MLGHTQQVLRDYSWLCSGVIPQQCFRQPHVTPGNQVRVMISTAACKASTFHFWILVRPLTENLPSLIFFKRRQQLVKKCISRMNALLFDLGEQAFFFLPFLQMMVFRPAIHCNHDSQILNQFPKDPTSDHPRCSLDFFSIHALPFIVMLYVKNT